MAATANASKQQAVAQQLALRGPDGITLAGLVSAPRGPQARNHGLRSDWRRALCAAVARAGSPAAAPQDDRAVPARTQHPAPGAPAHQIRLSGYRKMHSGRGHRRAADSHGRPGAAAPSPAPAAASAPLRLPLPAAEHHWPAPHAGAHATPAAFFSLQAVALSRYWPLPPSPSDIAAQ